MMKSFVQENQPGNFLPESFFPRQTDNLTMTASQDKKIKKFRTQIQREKGSLVALRKVFPEGVDVLTQQIDNALGKIERSAGYDYYVKDFLEAQVGLIGYQKELLIYLQKLSTSVEELLKSEVKKDEPKREGFSLVSPSDDQRANQARDCVEIYIKKIKNTLLNTHDSEVDRNPWAKYWNIKRLKDEIGRHLQE